MTSPASDRQDAPMPSEADWEQAKFVLGKKAAGPTLLRAVAAFARIRADERERLYGWSAAYQISVEGFTMWAAKEHNAKWVRKIDGTPIQNDLLVCIAQAFADAVIRKGATDAERT